MYYIIILLIIAFDQITKYFVLQYVKPQITIPIIEDIFHLTFAENTGAAFSILSNRVPLLSVLTSLFTIILILYLKKVISNGNHSKLFPLTLAFIIGGALGNLIDRIRLGYVVDFFDFRLINFAIFNIADSFIVVGSIFLLYLIIKDEVKF